MLIDSFLFYCSNTDEKITVLKSDYQKLLMDSAQLHREKKSNEEKTVKLRQKARQIAILKKRLMRKRSDVRKLNS